MKNVASVQAMERLSIRFIELFQEYDVHLIDKSDFMERGAQILGTLNPDDSAVFMGVLYTILGLSMQNKRLIRITTHEDG